MPSDTATPLPFAAELALAGRSRDAPAPVARALDEAEAAALARYLGLLSLGSVVFEGTLAPRGAEGWSLTGRLTATAEQACVVSLEPVVEAIDARIERQYRPPEPGDAVETLEIGPDDLDAPEPLAGDIDLAGVITEALSLALAPYPRRPEVAFEGHVHAPPGVRPLTDAAMNPFAELAELRARMDGDDEA